MGKITVVEKKGRQEYTLRGKVDRMKTESYKPNILRMKNQLDYCTL